MKTAHIPFVLAAWAIIAALAAFSPAACWAQEAEEEPPPSKSKLDVPEEEEEPPPKKPQSSPAEEEEAPPKKSKLDAPEEEEAPPAKKSAPSPPEEEEAPPKKSKLDVEEEETPPKKPAKSSMAEEVPPGAPKTPSAGPAIDEDEEDKPERVCDEVDINQRRMQVRLYEFPVEFPIPSQLRDAELKFARLPQATEKSESIAYFYAKGSEVTGIRYYEDRMWQKAADALGVSKKRLAEPGATFDLSTPEKQEQVDKAENILVTAISEHDSAVQANRRKGVQWDAMFRQPLMQALLNIRLSRADLLLNEGQLEPAGRLCDTLLAEFQDVPGAQEAIRSRLERVFLTQARQAVQEAEQAATQEAQGASYAEARRLLDELWRRYPRNPGTAATEFRDGLMAQAKDLMRQAEDLPDDQAPQAKALLARAALIWPDLPRLQALRETLDDRYRVLHCGYTSLPENFAPMLAGSPVERHASSLLLESLVRWWDGKRDDLDPGEGGHYEPQLADGRPVPLARGRHFYLPAAHWSDSTAAAPHLVTLEDVRNTVKLLSDPNLPGHLPAWARLVRDDVQPVGNDPFTVCIWLQRDHWQPLSMMDFKILPRAAFPQGTWQELQAFNKSPVGTGPYMLGVSQDPNEVRFVANPNYRHRGKPFINEIVFHRLPATAAKDQFLQGNIHLLYDVQPEHVAEIRQQRRTVRTLRGHSVWFLAPRYSGDGKPSPMDNENLRLAIAHAINREKILDQYFRVSGNTDHAALTGPYPKNSWAYNARVEGFKPLLADGFITTARKELKTIPRLRLVFPDGDPITSTACTEMRDHLKSQLELELELVPVRPEAFASTVAAGQFELAYWRHDFKDQTYWLWPLLDPQGIHPGGPNGPIGSNFMRYYQDQDLADLFSELNLRKHFPDIQKLTHKVHEHIYKKAIVIPLWQLDTYVAVDEALSNVRLDPWVLYGNVEEWDLRLRSK